MGKFHDMLGDSGSLRPLAYRILASPAVNRFPPYRFLYARRIAAQQRAFLPFPRVVAIESTNRCNAACVMCGHRQMRRAQGVMAMPLYESLIGQLDGRLGLLLLSGYGEPLLDPQLARRVMLAKRRGIKKVGIVTNAALLGRAAATELAAAGLDLVHISMDGASRDTYDRLRVNLDFDAVAANIDGLLALRPRPAVHIQMVLFEQNRADAARIRRRWGGRAERIIIRQAQDWAGQVDIPEPAYTPHLQRRSSWPPCRYLWDQLNVSWDGAVPLCCLDYEGAQAIGDAARQPLAGIWAGDTLRGIRERHNQGAWGEIPLCRDCGYFSVWW